MSKHTKGPWFYERDTQTIRHGEQDGDLNPNSLEVDIGGFSGEAKANALLTAAAPELLEACKKAKAHLEAFEISGEGNPCLAIDYLLKAIAKAEGSGE